GGIAWDKTGPGTALLRGAQRLANGNTFITTRTGLTEIDRDGKEVSSVTVAGTVLAARKLRTGEVAYLTLQGKCVRLDKEGKEVASFDVAERGGTGGIDLLPNGHVLLPLYTQGKVVEFDDKGKEVWSA